MNSNSQDTNPQDTNPQNVHSQVLRTILVGVGARGRWPVRHCRADGRFEPVALVDKSPDFLRAAQEELGLPDELLFDDLGAALQNVEADAVILCTPTKTHAPLSRIAFDAKKHVLVEKGMTSDWDEAVSLVAEAQSAGVKFCVAQNYRYQPTESAISTILNAPSHPHFPGELALVEYVHHRYRPEPRTLNYPFAMVWDMGCHHVDSLSLWLGAARRVTAHSYNAPWSAYEHDANISAVIEYESGAVCNYTLTHTATISDYHLILQGERGALRAFDGPLRFFPVPSQQLGASEPVECEVPSSEGSERGVLNAFARYIINDEEPGISGRNNLKTLAVCEMLVRSAREGRTVDASELT
jgi:predicted dehydrogenase